MGAGGVKEGEELESWPDKEWLCAGRGLRFGTGEVAMVWLELEVEEEEGEEEEDKGEGRRGPGRGIIGGIAEISGDYGGGSSQTRFREKERERERKKRKQLQEREEEKERKVLRLVCCLWSVYCTEYRVHCIHEVSNSIPVYNHSLYARLPCSLSFLLLYSVYSLQLLFSLLYSTLLTGL